MKYERLFEGGAGAFLSANGNVFALNGCLDENESERYKPSKDQWDLIPSFATATGHESLNFYVAALIKEE